MNLDVIEKAIEKIVLSISGIKERGAVDWIGRASTATGYQGHRIRLRLSRSRSLGTDENRRSDGDEIHDQIVTVCGLRYMTLTIRVESMDETATKGALQIAENIRTRLSRQSLSSITNAANLAIVSWGDIVPLELREQSRRLSAYVLDVVLGTAENDLDTSDGAGGFIEHVEVDGAVSGHVLPIETIDVPS